MTIVRGNSSSALRAAWILVLVALGSAGCRFGGGSGFAAEIDASGDAGPEALVPSSEMNGSAGPAVPSTPSVPTVERSGSGAGGSPARQLAAAGANAPDGNCAGKRTVQVCDPIANTGCATELGMQCDVDVFATTLAGVCVFNAPPADESACLNIPPTESCPAQMTCVEEACAKICLCDADCDGGERCTKPVGSGGFKVCSAS